MVFETAIRKLEEMGFRLVRYDDSFNGYWLPENPELEDISNGWKLIIEPLNHFSVRRQNATWVFSIVVGQTGVPVLISDDLLVVTDAVVEFYQPRIQGIVQFLPVESTAD